MASGDYIAFIDSDDWVSPNYFECLISNIGSADIITCGFENVTDEEEHVPEEHQITVKSITSEEAMKIRDVFTYAWGRLYIKSCFNDVRFNEQLTRSEDIFLNYQVIPRCNEIKCIYAILYHRRIRSDSIVHTVDPKGYVKSVKAFVELSENEEDSNIILQRAYRSLLSCRYKCGIKPGQEEYTELEELKKRLKKQNKRLSAKQRIFFTIMVDCPWLFSFCSRLRNCKKEIMSKQ